VHYYASPEFKRLDAYYTQRERRRILDDLVEKIGDLPALVDPKTIREGVRSRKPAAAKVFIAALRDVYKVALADELVDVNPTAGIKAKRVKTDGWHSWTLDECLRFEKKHPLGTMARTAYALALYTMCRKSDLAQLGRPMERDGWLEYTQHKNRKRAPTRIRQPIVAPLREALNACQGKRLTYVETAYGRPYSIAGLGNKFRQWCDEAGLPNCSLHGLRKATAARLAEAGFSSRQIMAALGDKTIELAELYTRAADNARMANDALGGLFGEQTVPPIKIRGTKTRKKA
jgi:integrase